MLTFSTNKNNPNCYRIQVSSSRDDKTLTLSQQQYFQMQIISIKILNVSLASASKIAFLSYSTAPGLSNQQNRILETRPSASCHPSLTLNCPMQMPQLKARSYIRLSSTRLRYTPSLPDSSDPCVILNLEPGSVDLKESKRAYR